ncbi:sugar phosphate isomerase/epimerase family protein [Maribacter sp. 2307ULW6-5]|uniref:sugar phosphate isomerase/epimerase family protein n=1 Tax=Maribacter sp. 2307ULW6-5 TaxID=3386275 RepID=UPI0039BD0282
MYIQVKKTIFTKDVFNRVSEATEDRLLNQRPLKQTSRRAFIQKTALGSAATVLLPSCLGAARPARAKNTVPISGHVWVYASNFPPHWDCTPILESVFSDFRYAGMDGVELMEGQLRHDDAVQRIGALSKKYGVPVTGSSYGVGLGMWDASQHKSIIKDLETVVPRLAQLGGTTFGISVGSKKETPKTEKELDAQAYLLNIIRDRCKDHGIVANLHNHTYEVANDMHDLKGTLQRLPDFKLGPDINWLIRGGVDPLSFIETYGEQIVYLHLRDQYADGVWTEYVGQGSTDFGAIAAALRAKEFSGSCAVELAFPAKFEPQLPLKKTWKKSRKYVERTFGWS